MFLSIFFCFDGFVCGAASCSLALYPNMAVYVCVCRLLSVNVLQMSAFIHAATAGSTRCSVSLSRFVAFRIYRPEP